jgi:hypothetical protein
LRPTTLSLFDDEKAMPTPDSLNGDIPLTAIRELDEPFCFDAGDPPSTCRAVIEHARLVNAADLSYPIILSAEDRVMDGMRRVGKAVLLGRSSLDAVQFNKDPEPDYVGVHWDGLPYEKTSP